MKINTMTFWGVAFVFMNAPLAVATTYYVSTAGSDSNDGTTIDTPFKTVGKAALVVAAGDTVHLRGGTYPEYVILGKAGTSEARITFAAYAEEVPVIDGSGRPADIASPWSRPNRLISVEGAYTTLRGLEVRNSASFGVLVNADYAVVENMHVHNCFLSGVYFLNCHNGLVSGCTIHDIYNYGPDGAVAGGNADGIGSTSGNAVPPPTIYGHHTFRGNHVYNCSDDGIDTWTSQHNTIENNTVHDTGYTNASNGGYSTTGTYTITAGLPAGDGNGYKLGRGGNNLVRNNVAYANRKSGFDDNDGVDNILLNNTAYQTQADQFCFLFYTPGGTQLKNNLSYGGAPNMLTGNPIQDHNSWNLSISDPLFANANPASAEFLHLAKGSPAINAGVNVGLPYSGAAPDLGAFEYTGDAQ